MVGVSLVLCPREGPSRADPGHAHHHIIKATPEPKVVENGWMDNIDIISSPRSSASITFICCHQHLSDNPH